MLLKRPCSLVTSLGTCQLWQPVDRGDEQHQTIFQLFFSAEVLLLKILTARHKLDINISFPRTYQTIINVKLMY